MGDQASGNTYNLNLNIPPADGPETLQGSVSAAISAASGEEDAAEFDEKAKEISTKTKLIAAGVLLGLLVITILVGWGLYSLGDDSQSSLERLRDVAIVFSLFFFVLGTLVFVAVCAVLAYLAIVVKDEAIPALHELTGTLNQVRGTAEFVTESMARPIIKTSSTVAGWRAAIKTVKRK